MKNPSVEIEASRTEAGKKDHGAVKARTTDTERSDQPSGRLNRY